MTGGTTRQPMHAASRQVQRCSNTEYGMQNVGKGLAFVPIMQVPALVIMFGEPGIGRRGRHLRIEQRGASLVTRGVNDGEPIINDSAHPRMIIGTHGKLHGHTKVAGPLQNGFPVQRKVIGERLGEENGIFSVRVEMHKTITA